MDRGGACGDAGGGRKFTSSLTVAACGLPWGYSEQVACDDLQEQVRGFVEQVCV